MRSYWSRINQLGRVTGWEHTGQRFLNSLSEQHSEDMEKQLNMINIKTIFIIHHNFSPPYPWEYDLRQFQITRKNLNTDTLNPALLKWDGLTLGWSLFIVSLWAKQAKMALIQRQNSIERKELHYITIRLKRDFIVSFSRFCICSTTVKYCDVNTCCIFWLIWNTKHSWDWWSCHWLQ